MVYAQDMSDARYMVDGVLTGADKYAVSGEDPGLLRGRAVFETLRTHNGRLFRGLAHAERLVGSAASLGIPCPGADALEQELSRAIAGYPIPAKVNMILTGGGRRLVRVGPLDLERFGSELRVATRIWEPPSWLDGRSKHCSRALNEAAVRHAGTDEVFWLGMDGTITEATRSNVFGVLDGLLVTPPDDGRILVGVTRAALIEAAESAGIPIEERAIRPSDPFEELYASSTLKDLAPVVELDGKPMPGKGPVGEKLAGAFAALLERECPSVTPA